MSIAAIEVDGLSKQYRDGLFGRRTFDALQNVTLEVRAGEIFGLLGPNGAGKTTFIKILLGIIRKSQGAAHVFGRRAGELATRRRIGYLPEHLTIPRHHTGESALRYYGGLSGLAASDVRRKQDELFTLVGLLGRQRDPIRKYSKGMLQRLGLAQALLHDPDLLILDEPTDGLDPVGRAQVRKTLEALKQQGKTVFLNSHLLQEVEMVCDRVGVLDRGQLRGVGTVDEIAAHSSQELELSFELSGEEAAIRAIFPTDALRRWETLPSGNQRVTAFAANQSEVDQLVDTLRKRDVSIVGMIRRRITLEDAFLNLLQDPTRTT